MSKTVFAVFQDYNEAEAALHDLNRSGFQREDISLLAADRSGAPVATAEADDTAKKAGAGAATGGVAGLVLGLAALAIPGIGPIIAAGPLAAALTGAGVGAAAGGIIGALSNLGVSGEHANSYREMLRKGGTILAVRVEDDMLDRAEAVFQRHGAADIQTRDEAARRPNAWRPDDPHVHAPSQGDEGGVSDWGHTELRRPSRKKAPGRGVPMADPAQTTAPDLSDPVVRENWQGCWADKYTWEEYSDAYRFGYTLGASGRYGTSDWVDVEDEARRSWTLDKGDTWDRFRDLVRIGWLHRRGQRPAC